MSMPVLPTGFQHTRCKLAITCVKACFEIFSHESSRCLDLQAKRIQRWVNEIDPQLAIKHWSSGSKRALSKAFDVLADFSAPDSAPVEIRQRLWCAQVWAALTFVEDALISCGEFTHAAEYRKAWRYLKQTLTTFANMLMAISPQMDIDGTYIYEIASARLDGENYTPPIMPDGLYPQMEGGNE